MGGLIDHGSLPFEDGDYWTTGVAAYDYTDWVDEAQDTPAREETTE